MSREHQVRDIIVALRHEFETGLHTVHPCKCGRTACRDRCWFCLKEQLVGEIRHEKVSTDYCDALIRSMRLEHEILVMASAEGGTP